MLALLLSETSNVGHKSMQTNARHHEAGQAPSSCLWMPLRRQNLDAWLCLAQSPSRSGDGVVTGPIDGSGISSTGGTAAARVTRAAHRQEIVSRFGVERLD